MLPRFEELYYGVEESIYTQVIGTVVCGASGISPEGNQLCSEWCEINPSCVKKPQRKYRLRYDVLWLQLFETFTIY